MLRLRLDQSDHLFLLITKRIGEHICERDAQDVICRLVESGIVTKGEGELMAASVSDKALQSPAMIKDNIRANILKQLVIVLLTRGEK